MTRNRPVELVNFLKPLGAPSPEFCDYFGVKSSLINKYRILNKLFKGNGGSLQENQATFDTTNLLENIRLEPSDPQPDAVTQKYLTILRDRFS